MSFRDTFEAVSTVKAYLFSGSPCETAAHSAETSQYRRSVQGACGGVKSQALHSGYLWAASPEALHGALHGHLSYELGSRKGCLSCWVWSDKYHHRDS